MWRGQVNLCLLCAFFLHSFLFVSSHSIISISLGNSIVLMNWTYTTLYKTVCFHLHDCGNQKSRWKLDKKSTQATGISFLNLVLFTPLFFSKNSCSQHICKTTKKKNAFADVLRTLWLIPFVLSYHNLLISMCDKITNIRMWFVVFRYSNDSFQSITSTTWFIAFFFILPPARWILTMRRKSISNDGILYCFFTTTTFPLHERNICDWAVQWSSWIVVMFQNRCILRAPPLSLHESNICSELNLN